MKGYKGTTAFMTCRGYQYEIGKTYKIDGVIGLCRHGFHFCKSPKDCFSYYDEEHSRFFEVESPDDCTIVGDDKCVTSEITFIRELSRVEINRIKYGYGNGNGYGYGYGNGYGYGYGYGNGYGYGYGNKNILPILNYKEI